MTQHQNQPHRTLLRTGFSVLFLAFSLLLTHSANAISCAIPTPKKAFLSSDLVFLATATNLKKKQMKYFQFYSNWKEWNPSNKDQIITVYSVKLNVKKVWKGSPGKILNYEWGSLSWGGYSFSEGVTFLIYAQQQKGEISTHWCDRTKSAENTEVEQLILDWIVEGLSMERIYERLASLVRGDKNGYIRAQAIRFLGNDLSAFRSRSTRQALLQSFQDPDPTVRIAVIKILNYLVSKEAIHYYMWKAFNDESLSVRLETILYFSPLVKNGWGGKKKEKMLAVLRKDIDQEKKILKSLGAKESEPHQMNIQKIIDAFYLFRAEQEKRNSIPMILEGLKSEYWDVQKAAIHNLHGVYPLAGDYLPELRELGDNYVYLKDQLDWIISEIEKLDKNKN